jgi:hypothetical protein
MVSPLQRLVAFLFIPFSKFSNWLDESYYRQFEPGRYDGPEWDQFWKYQSENIWP